MYYNYIYGPQQREGSAYLAGRLSCTTGPGLEYANISFFFCLKGKKEEEERKKQEQARGSTDNP